MPTRTMFKHPSLKEFLSRNQEAYDLAARQGIVRMISWEEQEQMLKVHWMMIDRLPELGRQEAWRKYAQNQKAGNQAFLGQINKLLDAAKKRDKAGESLKDAKQQEAHAKRKRSAGG